MPKPFTQEERVAIRARLMDEGLKRFARQGIRAMRIDDLCRDAGIAKGSFYAFFPSKEALFFAIADQRGEQHKAEMTAEMMAATGDANAVLGTYFDMLMQRLEADPLMRIMQDTGELAYAMRHVPPDYVENNARRDREFIAEMSEIFRTRHDLPHAEPAVLENILTLMFSLYVQRDYLETTGSYAPAVAMLREMTLKRLIEGPIT